MEVLYSAVSNGARRLTVREFLHCYRPDEIDKSRGIYSFAPRSPLLKVIFETPDSNRDWKSRYFFFRGWQVDMSSKGYGTHAHWHDLGHITPVRYAPILVCVHFIQPFNLFMFSSILLTIYFFAVRQQPQVDLEKFSFLEKIFAKTKPEEMT